MLTLRRTLSPEPVVTQLHDWHSSKGLGPCGAWHLPLGGRGVGCPTSTQRHSCPLRCLARQPPAPGRFIEEKSSFEYGQVNHALAAAMRTLVKEHLILVTQLEQLQRQGLLSLQKLWFYIQPAVRSMDILASLGMRLRGPWVPLGRVPDRGVLACEDGTWLLVVRARPLWLLVLLFGRDRKLLIGKPY